MAAVPVTSLVIVPTAVEGVGLPKLLAGVSILATWVVLWSLAALRGDHVPVPPRVPALVVAGFVAALLVATSVAGWRGTAVLGQYGRWSGLLLYLSAAGIFLAAVACLDIAGVRRVIGTVLATAGVLTALGLMQGLGVSDLGLESRYSPIVATLGNPNFFSAFIGIAVPLALWGALWSGWVAPARVAAGAGAVAGITAALWSQSVQGPLVAFIGVVVAVLVAAGGQRGRTWRSARVTAMSVLVVGVLGVVAAAAGLGPLGRAIGSAAIRSRVWYSEAALGMFADHPLVGVGMDQYAGYFRRYRPLEMALASGVGDATDAAHSVPIGMFANGGVLLGLGYLAVVGLVLWASVVGYRTVTGERRFLLAGLVGAWTAYQLQSFISIDAPSLAYLHWVLAGAILATVRPWNETDVPSPRHPAGRTVRTTSPLTKVAAVTAGVLSLTGLWGSAKVLRADMAAGRAFVQASEGQAAEAFQSLERAVDLAPWQPYYLAERGRAYIQVGDLETALSSYSRALREDPRNFRVTVTAARVADRLDDVETAAALYDRAVVLEPNVVAIVIEAAEFFVEHGRGDRAEDMVQHVLRLAPDHAAARELADRLGS